MRTTCSITLVIGSVLCGCRNANPFTSTDFYVPVTTDNDVYEIDSVEPREFSQSEPLTIEQALDARSGGWTPIPLLEPEQTLDLTLADVRAAALANNLDLVVALYNPGINDTTVDEEQARFESTFFGSLRRTSIDSPTLSTLDNNQATIDNLNVGVRVPLRTGGTVTIDAPMTRTETNNPFSLLDPSWTTDLRFSLSHPLLRGAGVRPNTHGIRVARYQSRIVDAQTKLEAIRILANADRAYWRLHAAWQALDVAMQQYELAVDQMERSQRLVDQGEGAPLDVTRAESGVAQRIENIIIAERDILERQRELKRIMNRDDLPLNSDVMVVPSTDPNPIYLDLDDDALALFAVGNRMEMLEQELRLAIDRSTIDFERNQALPLVTLDYMYNVNGLGGDFDDSVELLGEKRFEDWAVGLNVEIPIGNRAAEARVNRAILTRVQRLATRAQRELAIRQEVFDVVDRLAADWQRILAARQAVVLATRVLESEQRIFDADERTSTDVLDAAAQLADAQLAELRALVDYQISQIDLAFATGTLLGRDQIRWDSIEPHDLPDSD